MITSEIKKHHPWGPSSLKASMLCPGKVNAEQGRPPVSSEAARQGTAAHELLNEAIIEGPHVLDTEAREIPVEYQDGDDTVKMDRIVLDQSDIDAVRVCYDYAKSKQNLVLMSETQVDAGADFGVEGMAGTSDLVLLEPANDPDPSVVLEVIDYKHGSGLYVEEKDCVQLISYGVGAVAKASRMGMSFGPKDRIRCTIVQPRYEGKLPVRSVTYMIAELWDWMQRFLTAIEESKNPDAKRVPGKDQCGFCLAAGDCVEAAQHFLASGDLLPGMNLSALNHDRMEAATLREPTSLSEDQIKVLLDNKGMIGSWLKKVQAYALQQAMQRGEYAGHVVVRNSGRREFTAPEGTELLAHLGKLKVAGKPVGVKGVQKLVTMSPNQFEEAYKSRMTKAEKLAMDASVVWSEGSLALEPNTTKKERVGSRVQEALAKRGLVTKE